MADNYIPEKYQQTHFEIAQWGVAPGEPVRVRDKRNRERVLGKNASGLALGIDFNVHEPDKM